MWQRITLLFLVLKFSTITVFAQDNYDSIILNCIKNYPNCNQLNNYIIELEAKKDLKSETDFLLKAYEISITKNNDDFSFDINYALGTFFENSAKFDLSVKHLLKAYDIATKIKSNFGIALSAEYLGVVYKQLYSYYNALHFLNIAQQFVNDTAVIKTYLPRGIYSNKAEIFLELKQYDSAFLYITKAKKATFKSDYFGLSRVEQNFAAYYNHINEFEKAIIHAKLGIDYALHLDSLIDYNNLINNRITYANSLLGLNKFDEAKQQALQAFKEHTVYGDDIAGTYSIEISKQLSSIYSKLKNNDSAFYYLQLYNKYNDSVFNKKRIDEIETLSITNRVTNIEEQNKQEAAVYVEKLKKQKILIIAFVVLAVVLVVAGFWAYKYYSFKKRLDQEKLRSNISKDLHDDIGSTLSSINIISQVMQTKKDSANQQEIIDGVSKINELSQKLLTNMNDIVWKLKPDNDSMEIILSKMREFACNILEARNIDYELNFPKQLHNVKVDLNIKNHLYLIFKEVVNNLCKHSMCSKAIIDLKFSTSHIIINIEDNGIGFDETKLIRTSGLQNLRNRVKEIKGTIDINSKPNIGTMLSVQIPLR